MHDKQERGDMKENQLSKPELRWLCDDCDCLYPKEKDQRRREHHTCRATSRILRHGFEHPHINPTTDCPKVLMLLQMESFYDQEMKSKHAESMELLKQSEDRVKALSEVVEGLRNKENEWKEAYEGLRRNYFIDMDGKDKEWREIVEPVVDDIKYATKHTSFCKCNICEAIKPLAEKVKDGGCE